MHGLIRDTLNDVMDRKVLWIFAGLVLFSILICVLLSMSDVRVRIEHSGPGGGPTPEGSNFALVLLRGFMSVIIFVSAMAAASSLPSMLGRGRSDYFLSKPLSRTSLFLGKFVGLMWVYGAAILVSGFLVYLTVAAALQNFSIGVVWLLLFSLLELFVWLAIIAGAGVFSGSTTVAIVTAFLVWILQSILAARQGIELLLNSKVVTGILDVAYWIVPKTSQLSRDGLSLAVGEPLDQWLTIPATLGFGLVALLTTLYLFNRKEL